MYFSNCMNERLGIIFSYSLEAQNPVERTQFNRKFLGYNDKSQYGKYSYFREGVMTEIPHVYVSNSLFIISEKDLKKIRHFCKRYDANLFVRKVVLTKSDLRMLSK